MSSTPNPPPASTPDPGLPPVLPPSGQQILKLFVVPAIIVLVLVGLFLLGPTLANWFRGVSADTRTSRQFLAQLDDSNPDIRWRAASDLAQVLLRKEDLAADPEFALALAEQLQNALDGSAEAEKKYAARHDGLTTGEKARELAKLEPERNLIMYLAASLGNFRVPVGVPLLEKMARQTEGMEPDALAERRRRALFALAALGEKLNGYDKLSDEQKDDIEEKLKQAQDSRARATLAYLQARRQGKADTMGVADTLAKCAEDEDPSLRFMAAFASNFWHGTTREEKQMEDMLVRLSNDSGAGADKLEERLARNPNTKGMRETTTKKGFDVQVNATIALARRGSPRVRMDLLAQMLDPEALGEIFVIKQTPAPATTRRFLFWTTTTPAVGPHRPNEALVVLTLTDTLKAVTKLHQKRPEMKLDRLQPLIDELAQSDNPAVRFEAKQTQLALKKE